MDHLVHAVMSLINFEVGGHGSASKGRIHVIAPFIGRKNGTLRARQQSYDDVHGWYRARMEQLFAYLWHWGLVRTIWRGGPNELHQSVRVLLHLCAPCCQKGSTITGSGECREHYREECTDAHTCGEESQYMSDAN